ncbi:hypothetical protein [Streptomyces sp. 7-21]|uniref:hypothetical protein n=1 Tax=Streptomyces sp. 7-21 TaxID=2802283 RepID=UPI00191CCAA3|nr:hypothetical protein [Streptomyces sp. 7-21]MBL1067610.1 hypothetical protein [Streptomyces sp. 7-21]
MSRLTATRRFRAGLVAGAALLAFTGTVTSCSSSGSEDDETIEGAQTEDPGQGGDGDQNGGAEDDVAALEELYDRYWDARVEIENAEELDMSPLEGIATDGEIESQAGRLQPFKDDGIHRRGEPAIENVTVSVEGDTARIEACKNEDGWELVQNGEVVEGALSEDVRAPHTYVVSAERQDGDWLISGTLPREEATITC